MDLATREHAEQRTWYLLGLGTVATVLFAIVLLVSVLVAPATYIANAMDVSGTGTTCGGTAVAPTPGCINPGSNAIVTIALEMTAHLHGNPDVTYDAGFPAAAIAYWQRTCPHCSEWQNGNLQCVMFVLAAYGVAGEPAPVAGNAVTFWSLYASRPGWSEINAGAASTVAQRGLPAPGDMMVWYSGFEPTVGHIAIVVQVAPPANGQAGAITFAEANGPAPLVTTALLPDLSVQTWAGYTVLGYIRRTA